MDQEKIGKLIAKQRKMKGLTQQQLGDMVGVGYRAVSKWETGLTMPDISNINELCKILDITSDELLKGELNKKENKRQHKLNRLLIISIIIFIIIITIVLIKIFIINNKLYEYSLNTDNHGCYIEGIATYKGSRLSLNINKILFDDYNINQASIKNYQYRIASANKIIFGFGYNDMNENISKPMSIYEFQKIFTINYNDIPATNKEWILKNNLTLEINLVDVNDNVINKKIEIVLVPRKKYKSTD